MLQLQEYTSGANYNIKLNCESEFSYYSFTWTHHHGVSQLDSLMIRLGETLVGEFRLAI